MKPGPLADLAADYKKRITWPVQVIEVEAKGKLEGPALKAREAEALAAKIPPGATIVALDERGKTLTSPALAAWIGKQQSDAVSQIVFLIGGADGLDDTLRGRAQLTLAFGALTWPHMLARVMLLEQLYRAQQILAGHPYHRA
jgi:23S rRNA (pseudouridine1915-N3)-methyltransferase